MAWLVRDDDVLAVAETVSSRRDRRRGLIGRADVEGAFVLRPCRQVHTIGMQFPLDVAFCDRSGRVLHTATLAPRRVSKVVWRAAFAIEARAGSLDRWQLRPGDVVEIKG